MTSAGLGVPPGFALTVSFFKPWITLLKGSEMWSAFVASDEENLKEACDLLKERCSTLEFTQQQNDALKSAMTSPLSDGLLAVRSSSPEEDLEGSSFAGAYETVLGVTPATMHDALRTAFASCLDVRIVVYKRQNGFDTKNPRIAVAVQKQIASEVAGVGFSVNPITNSYDEAVFNANWGLGETVVAGIASPDYFLVDKYSRAILERQVGKKEISIHLGPDGGTQERPGEKRDQLSLSDDQTLALLDEINKIEALYKKPMDIEWAFEKGSLYMLQARPITTHIPLPKEMITRHGKPKRLYLDASISIQGILKPISVMGISVLNKLMHAASYEMFGNDITTKMETTVPVLAGGRLYLNLSNMFAAFGKQKLVSLFSLMDTLMAQTLEDIPEADYINPAFPKYSILARMILHAPKRIANALRARFYPLKAKRFCEMKIAEYKEEMQRLVMARPPLSGFANDLIESTIALIARNTVPSMVMAKVAHSKIISMFPNATGELKTQLDNIDKSLPGNVTVEMGIAIYNLAMLLPEDERHSAKGSRTALKTARRPRLFWTNGESL